MDLSEALEKIMNEDSFSLARRIEEISSPDNSASPGAMLLLDVRDGVVEEIRSDPEEVDTDSAELDWTTILDGVVPIQTDEIWQTFVDLTAYQHSSANHQAGVTTDSAQAVLESVAKDLGVLLWKDIQSYLDEETE